MPLYEYVCRDCGNRFEELKRSGDTQCPECPSCGGKTDKAMSAASVSTGPSLGGGFPAMAPSSGGCGSGGFS